MVNDELCSQDSAALGEIIKRGRLWVSEVIELCPQLAVGAKSVTPHFRTQADKASRVNGLKGKVMEVLWARNKEGLDEVDAADE